MKRIQQQRHRPQPPLRRRAAAVSRMASDWTSASTSARPPTTRSASPCPSRHFRSKLEARTLRPRRLPLHRRRCHRICIQTSTAETTAFREAVGTRRRRRPMATHLIRNYRHRTLGGPAWATTGAMGESSGVASVVTPASSAGWWAHRFSPVSARLHRPASGRRRRRAVAAAAPNRATIHCRRIRRRVPANSGDP